MNTDHFCLKRPSQNLFIFGRYLPGYRSCNDTGIHFGIKRPCIFQRQAHKIRNTLPLYWRAGLLGKLLFRSSLGTEIFFKRNLSQRRTRPAFLMRPVHKSCVSRTALGILYLFIYFIQPNENYKIFIH